MKQMEVWSVRIDMVTKMPVVLLKDISSSTYLPIWIGVFEATQIQLAIENIPVPRPMTHDLMKQIIEKLNVKLKEIQIYSIVDGTFHAKLMLTNNSKLYEIDARPSDAIALSLRTGSPIFVAEEIIKEAGIIEQKDDDEEIKRFRDFISTLKPSDFKL